MSSTNGIEELSPFFFIAFLESSPPFEAKLVKQGGEVEHAAAREPHIGELCIMPGGVHQLIVHSISRPLPGVAYHAPNMATN